MERYGEREPDEVPRARGDQRRMGDIETRTVTDKPSVNYKLLRDVLRLRKSFGTFLNRDVDKAVRCTLKRKRLHEGRCQLRLRKRSQWCKLEKTSLANPHLH